jgi:16S rRNA (uracil1498-N3)-methyltransferase
MAVVDGDEAHHVLHVVRLRQGDEVVLIDGSGREARARMVGASRRDATFEILAVAEVDREPGRRVTLAVALPRKTRADFLIEKCTELGVARLIPMMTERSVVDGGKHQENHLRRWRRNTIEAAKQSGRTRLMEVGPAMSFEQVLAEVGGDQECLIASPDADAVGLSAHGATLPPNASVLVLIGPEGGFTPEEEASAKAAGCTPVALGKRILRVETAAIAVAALVVLE